jgi:transcriptional regulator with XRE-family HTH domain
MSIRNNVLRYHVNRSGLTQREIAKRMGIHYNQVWRWFNGRQKITHANLHKLADVIGMDLKGKIL